MPKIRRVVPGSFAAEGGVEPGDLLVSVNGMPVRDVFDYRFILDGGVCAPREGGATMRFRRHGGEEWTLHAAGSGSATCENPGGDEFGLAFEGSLMDKRRPCANRCVFCFVDQLPKGMRRSLYFKDDDPRLSFLHGNYVTLTNARKGDLERIARYRMSPINVSVHSTDPALRAQMLRPLAAEKAKAFEAAGAAETAGARCADVMPALRMLTAGGIEVNAQIVLCRGINDGSALDRTLSDLGSLGGRLASVSVVPVGLTRHREALFVLEPFGKDSAKATLRQVNEWQRRFRRERGSRVVYAADELYLLADEPMPGIIHYEGFPQLENGVGMCALFLHDFRMELRRLQADLASGAIPARKPSGGAARAAAHVGADTTARGAVYVLTGTAARGMIASCVEMLETISYPKPMDVQVVAAKNYFFGESVTTAGLLTGQDILRCANNLPLGESDTILLPKTMFRHGTKLFLDGISLKTLREKLKVDIIAIDNSGRAFARAALRL